jgi:hypothetical protein
MLRREFLSTAYFATRVIGRAVKVGQHEQRQHASRSPVHGASVDFAGGLWVLKRFQLRVPLEFDLPLGRPREVLPLHLVPAVVSPLGHERPSHDVESRTIYC